MHLAPVAVGLALLYAFNNLAAFQLFRMSDPATISVSKSVASIVVAAITYVIFGKKYAYPQWICLALQVVGLSIIHLNVSSSLPSSSPISEFRRLCLPREKKFLSRICSSFFSVNAPERSLLRFR